MKLLSERRDVASVAQRVPKRGSGVVHVYDYCSPNDWDAPPHPPFVVEPRLHDRACIRYHRAPSETAGCHTVSWHVTVSWERGNGWSRRGTAVFTRTVPPSLPLPSLHSLPRSVREWEVKRECECVSVRLCVRVWSVRV